MTELKVSSRNPKEPEYIATFKVVKECFQKTHLAYKGRTSKKLRQKNSFLGKFRLFLYEKPFASSLLFPTVYLVFVCFPVYLLIKTFGNQTILALFILIALMCYSFLLLFFEFIKPRYQVFPEDLMRDTFKLIKQNYLPENKNISSREEILYIKKKLQKAVHYYSQKRLFLRIVLLCNAPFFVNCLASKDFQKALFESPNISIVWAENPLGLVALLSIFLIAPLYHFRYNIPTSWMKDVLAYIEIEFCNYLS